MRKEEEVLEEMEKLKRELDEIRGFEQPEGIVFNWLVSTTRVGSTYEAWIKHVPIIIDEFNDDFLHTSDIDTELVHPENIWKAFNGERKDKIMKWARKKKYVNEN